MHAKRNQLLPQQLHPRSQPRKTPVFWHKVIFSQRKENTQNTQPTVLTKVATAVIQARGFLSSRLPATQKELTPCEQGRRRESSFPPHFFWISFVKGDFEKRIFQFRVRACVRACVRPSVRPEAYSLRIGRFCLTKNEGF